MVNLDPTYLSKLENDRADYSPTEGTIRELAEHLDLDAEQLIFLAGRLPEQYRAFVVQHHTEIAALFSRMQTDPDFAGKVFNDLSQQEENEYI